MRIAVCSDEPYPVHQVLIGDLKERGYEVVTFGSVKTNTDESWVKVAREAAEAVASGACDEGIFCCWTGTGISMAANKVPGIRAALCGDSETASGARIWNHANVLALSNRLLNPENVLEILGAWFSPDNDGAPGVEGVRELSALEKVYRKPPS